MRSAYLTAALLVAACYRYSPGPAPTPAAGTHVRFTLADSSLVALERVLGERTIAVEGLVLATTDSVYMMNVTATMKKGIAGDRSNRVVWAGESVSSTSSYLLTTIPWCRSCVWLVRQTRSFSVSTS